MRRICRALTRFVAPLGFLLLSAGFSAALAAPAAPGKPAQPPNILFFIMDDVGIDQMAVFGYGGATPPRTPNIDAIANAGVKFRNTWAMPECSPSRTAIFTGRWPLRTNVESIVTPLVLANSQVSPFEVTVPKVLKNSKARYESAMFGKFHLAGPDNYPYGHAGPHSLGWDYFHGFLDGEPYPIDTYAGGAGVDTDPNNKGPYECGIVPGAGAGACHFPNGSCTELAGAAPGLECATRGGLFKQSAHCSAGPQDLRFNTLNAYFVSPLVINRPDGTVERVRPDDARARGYRSTLEVNAAKDWIKQRDPKRPWMATVSFSAAHVPLQPAPLHLLRPGLAESNRSDCISQDGVRELGNQTLEALDAELGRLLVELGIAGRNRFTGALEYDPAASNTMVVILGDNGTYAPLVKLPFDPIHSKGLAYQTGVWVPLIVAGPLVRQPDREVPHMVNVADLFALFGEIGGIDVRKAVPAAHTLDAVSMLPYLTNPTQESLRTSNYTEVGQSTSFPPATTCVIPVGQAQGTDEQKYACVTIFPNDKVCTSQGGDSYPGDKTCCKIKKEEADRYPELLILPLVSRAIRNDRYKLVEQKKVFCNNGDTTTAIETEFYEVNQLPTNPRIDRPPSDKFPNDLPRPPLTELTPEQARNFNSLKAALADLSNSEVACPGDGNLNKKVTGTDLANWKHFQAMVQEDGSSSSWYDFNADGRTDDADRLIIEQNMGSVCLKQ
jgi:hypothetical protein